MELPSRNGHTFGSSENDPNIYKTFQNSSIWNLTEKDDHGNNYYANRPNTTRFDLNNNNNNNNNTDDAYPTFRPNISSIMPADRRTNYFDTKDQSSFNNNVYGGHYVQIGARDRCLSAPNDVLMEQIEPMDLSCGKNDNANTSKKSRHEVKHTNYFEPNSEISLPLPSNISESTLLILKSVYDIKYHRKPNCDKIFLEDPVNPKLYICKVCAKHVRSKWHHFQTHYSRDHKCSDCDAVYSRIDTLRTHAKKRHHTVIPRYYYGIPANVWHRVIVQFPDPLPKPPPAPKPSARTAGTQGE